MDVCAFKNNITHLCITFTCSGHFGVVKGGLLRIQPRTCICFTRGLSALCTCDYRKILTQNCAMSPRVIQGNAGKYSGQLRLTYWQKCCKAGFRFFSRRL